MKLAACFFALVLFWQLPMTQAQQPTSNELKFFESKIRPALVNYCYECHSAEEGSNRGGLNVDTREALLVGGDSGPAIVPRKLDESPFWEAVNWDGLEMPPSKKMPDSVIADFKKWIEMGAPDPRVREKVEFRTKITKSDIAKVRVEHWSFQSPQASPSATIDSLLAAKLNEANVKPNSPADAFTILRRLNFDLIGLPPTPTEIKSFHADYRKAPDQAIADKVDELLAKPQFGERWGRHWLDVARYAESSGSRNINYPNAWRYRDYVIDSLNADKPYDRFITEQIAGDLLPVKTDQQWQENLIATGFLAIGLKHHDQKNPRIFQADMIDEQIDTTTQAVLGLTVACARCHDHKYDPIPTDDYYALAGIFRSTQTLYGGQRVAQIHRTSDLLLLPIPDKRPAERTRARGQQSVSQLQSNLKAVEAKITTARRNAKNADDRKSIKGLRNQALRIQAELNKLNADGSIKTFGMGVQEATQPVNATILIGGEIERPAQEVNRGFLQVMGELNFQETNHRSSGRMNLAKSMTSKDNPLTARVMVNRIWMHLLGKPLVGTPNNFGLSGLKPQNQELLDYLAIRFMEENWSVKTLIREIALSQAYRRSSDYVELNYAADPDNQLLWRGNPRQLDAEAIRDSMLAFAGNLELKRPFGSEIAAVGEGRPQAIRVDISTLNYRSVYLPIVRDEVLEGLKLFDFADPNTSNAVRPESIVPTQALYLMNSDFVNRQANSMASVLAKEFSTTNAQIQNAFLWVYGRPATDAEYQASAAFFKQFRPEPPAAVNEPAPMVSAKQDDPKGIAFYQSKIRPILEDNCYRCHSGRRAKGRLSLDSKSGILRGGSSGPAVVQGEKDSLLLTSIHYKDSNLQMPPDGKLSRSEISNVTKWIRMGAPMPSETSTGANSSTRRGRRNRRGMQDSDAKGSLNGSRDRRTRQMQDTRVASASTSSNPTLAAFCQTLMASARFRILN